MNTPDKRVEEIIAVAKRNIVPKNLQHIPLSDDDWMKGKSKVECVNDVYQWVIDTLTPLTSGSVKVKTHVHNQPPPADL